MGPANFEGGMEILKVCKQWTGQWPVLCVIWSGSCSTDGVLRGSASVLAVLQFRGFVYGGGMGCRTRNRVVVS